MEAKEIKKECSLAVLLLAVGGLILWQAYSYDPESRQFPVFLGWLFLLCSGVNFIRVIPAFNKLSLISDRAEKRSFLPLLVLSFVSLYTLSIPWIGYYPATGLFLLIFMLTFGYWKKNAKQYLLGAAVFLGIVYLFFSVVLGTRLPMGELWGL